MEGSVRKRGDNWYYYFSYIDEFGKRKKVERKVGLDKREAQRELRKAITSFETGFVEDAHEKVGGYLNDWLEYIKDSRKINTYNRYKGIVENSIEPYIGKIKLKDLKSIHIEKMLREEKKRNISGSTLEGIYLACNSALNRAYKLRLIQENPCNFIEKPKRDKFVGEALRIEDIDTLFDSIDTTKYNGYIMNLAIRMAIELGIRRGELSGLEWHHVDFANNTIEIVNNMIYSYGHIYLTTPKTDASQRKLYASASLMTLLKYHKKTQTENRLFYGSLYEQNEMEGHPCDFIMTWESGKYVHPLYYTTRFKDLIKKAGLNTKIRFHDLRHTNATLLLQQGVDFKTIQIRLGHSDLSTTMDIYSHVTMDMQKKAVDKLNKALGDTYFSSHGGKHGGKK